MEQREPPSCTFRPEDVLSKKTVNFLSSDHRSHSARRGFERQSQVRRKGEVERRRDGRMVELRHYLRCHEFK